VTPQGMGASRRRTPAAVCPRARRDRPWTSRSGLFGCCRRRLTQALLMMPSS
jgi:hypothetical protein